MTTPIVQVAPINRAIEGRLRAKAEAAGMDVFRGLIAAEETLERSPNGAIRPTAVLQFGRPIPSFEEDISGHRTQLKIHNFSVIVIAPNDDDLAKACDVVSDALQGYEVSNSGEIQELGTRAENPVQVRMTPFRYACSMGFSLTIGTSRVP